MLFTAGLQAQIKATTEDGKAVLLMEDGTWKIDSTAVAKKKLKKSKKKRKKGATGPTNPALASISCGDICETKMDPTFGEEVTVLSEVLEIKENGRNRMAVNLSANKSGTLFWNINVIGQQGCKNRTPQVKVSFTDGSNVTLEVANDFICDNNTTLYLGKRLGKKGELALFQNKTIATITVVNQDSSEVTGELATEQANILQKAFLCLTGK